MSHALGIDRGTTHSVISRLVDGRPVAIPVEGSPIVPSVVVYADVAAHNLGTRVYTVALSVADAGKLSQAHAAQSPAARKARALMERLSPELRGTLERLLEGYEAAQGDARERAEEALLDFFLEHEFHAPEP